MKEECGVKSITECSDPKNSKSAQVPIKISVNHMCYLNVVPVVMVRNRRACCIKTIHHIFIYIYKYI